MKTFSLLLFFLAATLHCQAQATDKADADKLIYDMLSASHETENWHPRLALSRSMMEETAERGIFRVKGAAYQVESLRSDFYVTEQHDRWVPLYDARFPMETMVNLMLNRLEDNRHTLELRHHQYGNVTPTLTLPMQNLYDLLARNMQLYCSVTYIDPKEIRAVLVFHQQRMNFIHLLEIRTSVLALFDKESVLKADFYTNIPQDNVNSIFGDKKQ